jgi:hypothetical protein
LLLNIKTQNQIVSLLLSSTYLSRYPILSIKYNMSTPISTKITQIVSNGPARSEVGRKQLILALGGLYIASTTATAKPLLVWEEDKGYARYYIPEESLHSDIKRRLTGTDPSQGSSGRNIDIAKVHSVASEDGKSQAVIERLTVGPKSTTWVRFIEGPFKRFIRFERSEIGWLLSLRAFLLALSLNTL